MSKYLLDVYTPFNVEFTYGKGSVLFDKQNKDYIDFTSGIGVSCLGHGNSKLIKTVTKQAEKLIHLSNIYPIKAQEQCAKKVLELSGYKNMQCFFCNSGTEANEAAIKLIRKYAHNKGIKDHKIITLENSFHGRTLTALNATGQKDKQAGFEPFPDEFVYAKNLSDIKNMLDKSIVAVMVEPVQGEGGITALDKKELLSLNKYLKQKDILFAVDEIQTGVFRTGEFLASNLYGLEPDIITMAKGLAGGLPIGLMMANKKGVFLKGDHGSTFGGNPLCTKTAYKVLNILKKKHTKGDLEKTNSFFQRKLDKVLEKNKEMFFSKTGLGLMSGLKLKDEKDLIPLLEISLKNKVLVLRSGKDIIRFLPALNVSKKEIKEGFKRFQKAIDQLQNKKGE